MKTTYSAKTEKEAILMAKTLLKKVKFKGFKIRVHENLGWHYSVENEFISVSPSGADNEYFALLKPHYSYYGKAYHSGNVNKLIKQTINLLVKHAREESEKAKKALESLR